MATHVISEHTTVIVPHSSYKAYKLLQTAFVAAPLIAGVDKFFGFLVNWTLYLSPVISSRISADVFMKVVGVAEIAAAMVVMANPRIGGRLVAFWLWAIILNLLSIPGYYDIALRDFGLSLGALALSNLSEDKSDY